jgi:hypothetical protein
MDCWEINNYTKAIIAAKTKNMSNIKNRIIYLSLTLVEILHFLSPKGERVKNLPLYYYLTKKVQ